MNASSKDVTSDRAARSCCSRSPLVVGTTLLSLVWLLGCGTKVAQVEVPNRPVADPDGQRTSMKGMSPEMLEYFKARHPAGSWELPPTPAQVAVGPTLFTRELVNQLLAKPPGRPDNETVASSQALTLTAGAGELNFIFLQQQSPEVQAVIVQALAASDNLMVKALDEAAGLDLYRGRTNYAKLAQEQRVKFFVESTLAGGPGGERAYRAYLRFVDTRSSLVVAAVSAEGPDVASAARAAAAALISRINAKP